MRLFLGVALVLCLAVAIEGETTEYFKNIIRPIAEGCGKGKPIPEEDLQSVLNLGPTFSPSAKCLAVCVMENLNLMKDGRLQPPEVQLEPYKRIFADVPERLDNALEILKTCQEEIAKNPPSNSCELGFAAILCTSKKTYAPKQ